MRYVTDLMVLEGENAEPPGGWKKIDKDLNAGAGGAFLYFAYEEGDKPDRALTNIKSLVGQDQSAPEEYTKIDVDLNKGANGKFIYIAFTRDPRRAHDSPIVALDVIITDRSDEYLAPPWIRVDQDLNEGAKGKYVYLFFQTAGGGGPRINLPV